MIAVIKVIKPFFEIFVATGNAVFFLGNVLGHIVRGHIRWREVFKQAYEQGVQSVLIVAMASFASGAVLALQGFVMLNRFGAKEYVAQLVVLSLVRELSPVFTAFIFSGKAGARMTAELGTMNVNDQILATRTLGVDPGEFLVVPRMVAAFFVLPGLVILSELVGILGGYCIGVFDADIPTSTYIYQTIRWVRYVDLFSGLIKTLFFGLIIGWVCCYQGFNTKGGSLGVGQFTTKAVAFSYMLVVISNTVLTKIILMFWG